MQSPQGSDPFPQQSLVTDYWAGHTEGWAPALDPWEWRDSVSSHTSSATWGRNGL
jgi:hypothetical protein